MANYYEMLGVSTESTMAEIETAIDEQYRKWNQLVTHHDQKIVAEANQAKQTLQDIRSTLLDPEKRKIYDSAIGLGGAIGGLGDPDIILQTATNSMGVPLAKSGRDRKSEAKEKASQARTDAWLCPKCGKANPIGTTFCDSCGFRLAGVCPECETLSELEKSYCPKCGCMKEEVFNEKKNLQIKELGKLKANILSRRSTLQSGNRSNEVELLILESDAKKKTGWGIFWIVAFIVSLFILADTDSSVLICSVPIFIIIIVQFVRASNKRSEMKDKESLIVDRINMDINEVEKKIRNIEDSFYKDGINIHELIK